MTDTRSTPWFAVQTRPRHEKVVNTQLQTKGYETFMPTYRARRRWADRVKVVVLPLFAAQPLLGPIYVRVDNFMPPDFPLLLIVPAFAIDLVMQRRTAVGNDWLLAAALAGVFLVSFLAVQWPFANFLMSPWARNWFFVSNRMAYGVDPAMQQRFYELKPPDGLAVGLPIAMAIGFASARLGLWWGNWMSRVQR